ncbi:MAG: prepilin-type N-terminal cleavage/methylation domain-containing protein [Petrotogales bacterium]
MEQVSNLMNTEYSISARKKGFTIVEVLVSLFIIAIIVTAIIPLLMKSIEQTNKNQYLTEELSRVQKNLEDSFILGNSEATKTVIIETSEGSTPVSIKMFTAEFGIDNDRQIIMFLRSND